MDLSVNLNLSYSVKAAQGDTFLPAPASKKSSDGPVLIAALPERSDLEKAVKDFQAFATSSQRNLEFSIYDSTHQVVVKVIATDTGEVVRQLPTESALKLAQSLSEGGSMLFDTRV
jgi:flagellar protein FlaG